MHRYFNGITIQMPQLRKFFLSKPETDGSEAPDESWRISRAGKLFRLLTAFAGGALYAAALPPFNLEPLVFASVFLLYLVAAESHWRFAALAGWVWGLGWSLFAYQFLREIDPAVPYLLAPVISVWPAVWAGLIPFLKRNTLYPLAAELGGFEEREKFLQSSAAFGRWLCFAVGSAALFTLLEWTRSRLFNWNDLAVTQYRNLALIQLAAFTGSYGINFLIALAGGALYAACRTGFRRPGLRVLLAAVLTLTLAMLGGLIRLDREKPVKPNWFPAVIQGDISQRRNANTNQAQEALEIYLQLSRDALAGKPKPEILLWPESAVPVPYRSTHSVSFLFRIGLQNLILQSGVPMLIGAIDFEDKRPGSATPPGMTNSALFFNHRGRLRRKYDKIHRVPYGEYIPFRRCLPGFIVRMIDMNRDLVPGADYNPIEVRSDVRAGTAICYEGVFGYLTREFARRGANVLVVLSNDAWYPKSSEPEQHLANATLRAVETGLPMVRCGNNGGSLVVTPYGRITQVLTVDGPEQRPELRRGRGVKTLAVGVEPNPAYTFYVRHSEWFIAVLAAVEAVFWLAAFAGFKKRKQALLDAIRRPGAGS